MEAKASCNYVRISPRKMRLVANEIRGYVVPEAIDILKHIPKRASQVILKTLLSAVANAKYINSEITEGDLYVKKIYVDEGPRYKRLKPRARGRADIMKRRTSHLTIVVSDE